MMDQEIADCKSKQAPTTPKTPSSSGTADEEEKVKGCGKNADKNWNSSYVSRLLKELLDLNEPIVMAGPEDFRDNLSLKYLDHLKLDH